MVISSVITWSPLVQELGNLSESLEKSIIQRLGGSRESRIGQAYEEAKESEKEKQRRVGALSNPIPARLATKTLDV